MKKKRSMGLRFIPLLIMSILIVYLSSQTGNESGKLSFGFLKMIGFSPELIKHIHFFGRKMAHVTEYFLLTAFTARFIKATALRNKILLTFIYPFLFAMSDEYHQTFVPGRAGQFKDILVDSIGIISALSLIVLFNYFKRRDNTLEPL